MKRTNKWNLYCVFIAVIKEVCFTKWEIKNHVIEIVFKLLTCNNSIYLSSINVPLAVGELRASFYLYLDHCAELHHMLNAYPLYLIKTCKYLYLTFFWTFNIAHVWSLTDSAVQEQSGGIRRKYFLHWYLIKLN